MSFGVPKSSAENLVEIRGLPDVPQRLGMVHRDKAVQFRRPTIPGRAVCKVGAHEGRNLTCGIDHEARWDHISYHHVAIDMELQAILVVDPLTDSRILPLPVKAGICNLFSPQVGQTRLSISRHTSLRCADGGSGRSLDALHQVPAQRPEPVNGKLSQLFRDAVHTRRVRHLARNFSGDEVAGKSCLGASARSSSPRHAIVES